MQRVMLKSKIHRARITETELYYTGSITLDEKLLKAANILAGEQVQVLNLNTGARFWTYTIPAEADSGTVILNGPAARCGEIGDHILVLSFGLCDDDEAKNLIPIFVNVDAENQIRDDSGG